MSREDVRFLSPQPQAAPRWSGLGLRFLFWLVAYALAAVMALGVVNLMMWR